MRGFFRAFIIGTLFAIIFSWVAVWSANRQDITLAATQISCISLLFCLALVVVVNPVLKKLRLSVLAKREIFLIFVMVTVPASIPLYSYLGQVIPLAGTLFNPRWNTPQSGWNEKIVPNIDKSLFVQNVQALKEYDRGLRASNKEAYPLFLPKPDQSWGKYFGNFDKYFKDSDFRAKTSLWGDVPWDAWLGPLAMWFIIGMTFFVMFYAINELVFKQWYDHEKLVFPIAELSRTILGGEDNSSAGSIPAVFKNSLFWVGFTIAFLIVFYNGMVEAKWISGLGKIDLRGLMTDKLRDGALEGLSPLYCEIFFVVIGLAFLLPRDVLFSVWFFYVIMKLQILIAFESGIVIGGASWHSDCNFYVSQGGGAMELFGLIALWKVRHNFLAFLYRFAMPEGSRKISAQDIRNYTVPSLLFVLSSAGFIYFFMRGGVPFFMALFIYLFILFMIVTTVRIVAECGMLSFKTYFGAMHFIRIFGLLKFPAVFAVNGIVMLITIVSVMFWDLKGFTAPTMINARYIAEKEKISTKMFAFSMFWALGITLVVASCSALILVYDQGVDSMNQWFFNAFASGSLNSTTNILNRVSGLEGFDPNAWWFLSGAGLCGGLIYLRQFFFWIPHPIGLVLYVSPIINSYWFGFFIAWICKSLAVKYCSADGYKVVRAGFIGLIIGEMLAIGLSIIFGMLGFESMGLSLNRF